MKRVSSVDLQGEHVRLCSEVAAPGGAWAAKPALGAGSGCGPALWAGNWPSFPGSPARPEPDGGQVPRHGTTGDTESAGHRTGAAGREVPGAQVGAPGRRSSGWDGRATRRDTSDRASAARANRAGGRTLDRYQCPVQPAQPTAITT